MADEGTFCTTAEAVRKAGAGASAAASVEAFVNQFVKEAEGYIMVGVRTDYKTEYASLNAETKELLRDTTSNLAAIPIIQYDMSGYTSRTEAELMLNALIWGVEKNMLLLKDQKTATYSTT